MRRLWSALLLLLAGGCYTPVPLPPGPVDPPPPVPIDPPPVTPTSGVMTQAQFDAIPVGAAESDVVGKVGQPFRSHDAAGFHILTYVESGTSRTFSLWFKAGLLDHKGTMQ